MNRILTKAIKEDSYFCDHFLNIQLDFLLKLFKKTENPIVGNYIVKLFEKIKKYRFWKIIRPIIVDKYLNFWTIKFNYTPKLYKDQKRKIIYLPHYYPRDDIIYTFEYYKDEKKYIDFHLRKIELFFTRNFNSFFNIYLFDRNKKYEKKRKEILDCLDSKDIIHEIFPVVKISKKSSTVEKNIGKKIVKKYKDEIFI